MTYDDWKASGPHEDLPSVESDACDRCDEPWAWVADSGERLCEEHASAYAREEHRRDEGDDEMGAERERHAREWADSFGGWQ